MLRVASRWCRQQPTGSISHCLDLRSCRRRKALPPLSRSWCLRCGLDTKRVGGARHGGLVFRGSQRLLPRRLLYRQAPTSLSSSPLCWREFLRPSDRRFRTFRCRIHLLGTLSGVPRVGVVPTACNTPCFQIVSISAKYHLNTTCANGQILVKPLNIQEPL
jgi:hypothetical protein